MCRDSACTGGGGGGAYVDDVFLLYQDKKRHGPVKKKNLGKSNLLGQSLIISDNVQG